MYNLKQAPKQLNKTFDKVILSNKFKINEIDKCVCVKKHKKMLCRCMFLCEWYANFFIAIIKLSSILRKC